MYLRFCFGNPPFYARPGINISIAAFAAFHHMDPAYPYNAWFNVSKAMV